MTEIILSVLFASEGAQTNLGKIRQNMERTGRNTWMANFMVETVEQSKIFVGHLRSTCYLQSTALHGESRRAALALRGLRLARMARLAKLMRMPLLEELANLISGASAASHEPV